MVGYAFLGRDPQCRHAIHTVHAIKINTVNKITRLAVDQLDCFIGLSPQSWHFPGLEPSLPRRPAPAGNKCDVAQNAAALVRGQRN